MTAQDTVLEVPSDLTTRYLDEAITQLRFTQPELSAFTRTSTWQRRGAIGLGVLILASAIVFPVYTLRIVFGLITLVYFSVLFYKLRCLHRGLQLGAGGLARAYGGTAAECLRIAGRVAIVAMARLGLDCDFAELALLKARLRELAAEVTREQFNAGGVTLELELPVQRVAEAETRIADLSRGRIAVRRMD